MQIATRTTLMPRIWVHSRRHLWTVPKSWAIHSRRAFHLSSQCLKEDESENSNKDPKDQKSPVPEKKNEKEDSLDNVIDAEVENIKEDAKPSRSQGRNGRFIRTTKMASGEGDGNISFIEKVNIPKDYPQILAIPLTKRPLFPGFYKSLYIKDPQTILAIQNLMQRRQPYVGIFLAKDDDSSLDTVHSLDEINRVGVFAQITNIYQAGADNSALTVVILPHRRIRAMNLVPKSENPEEVQLLDKNEEAKTDLTKSGFMTDPKSVAIINKHLEAFNVGIVNVENMVDEPCNTDNPVIKALTAEILNVLKEISQINPLLRDQILTYSIQTGGNAFQDPAKLADFAAAVSSGDPQDLQGVLESLVIEERLQKALIVLKKELANAKLQQDISKEVDKKINRKQQEYYLMEQLKGIKKELGMETDGKDKVIEKFKAKAAKLKMPQEVRKVFDEEIQKLQTLEPAASEFNITRNYIDWLTQIPWGIHKSENFEIKHALEVLNEDHYGLKDVKDRILEFIAVGKLKGTVEGKIICLAGPPGVGKTSIGKSIARALGREFYRFSVGGLSDVAEIKGHRRTYVGAMPGKVVQAFKKVQTENPLIMIDEIDKLGKGYQGDPASALLELLDPEQNNAFLDHYMDVPVDLSKVLFVCTANVLDTIPGPLLDRMEVINVAGYVAQEKVSIASKYLVPAAIKAAGLEKKNIVLTDEAISSIIKLYCRESGVRNLKKHIDKVFRKAALFIVKKEAELEKEFTDVLEITPENLKDYVGSPVYQNDRLYETTPAGVVMGLAWTSMGGSVLYIESVSESAITKESKPHFNYTGQMGDVMKESAMIAYTYAKSHLARKQPSNKFFDKASIHLHVPEGATPKDGPSAGVTMTSSLLSLALNKPLIPDVAMTGEITLTGKVLKIGGVKEKTIASKRSGVKHIMLPAANRSDWDELEDYIKESLQVTFVSHYDEIFEIIFPH